MMSCVRPQSHIKKEAKVFSRARPPVKHLMKKVAEVAGVSFKVTRDSDGWLVCELRGDVLAVVRVSLTIVTPIQKAFSPM
jgi:hypothetical protein